LTIKSGTIPSAVNGRSSCEYIIPIVPFWLKKMVRTDKNNNNQKTIRLTHVWS
jgi:hypothetical protein